MGRKEKTTAKPSPPGQDSLVGQHSLIDGMPGLSMGWCSLQVAFTETLEIYLEPQHNAVSAPAFVGAVEFAPK